MPWYEFTGAAVVTSLRALISSSATTIPLNSGSGWPTGADGKVFTATLGDPLSGQAEEKILCSARSGDDVTAIQRGYDGTAPQEWGQNSRIRHTISAVFAAEMTDHVNDTNRDDHLNYHTAARHAAVLHNQAMLGTGSVGGAQLIDDSVTSAKVAPGTLQTSDFADGSLVSPKIPNLAITTPLIADDAVTNIKVADAAIDDVAKFTAGVQPWIVSGSNPGAVGANRFWFNTTKRALLVRNAGNTAWEVVTTLGAGINYTPTLFNFSIGAGVNLARYYRVGRFIIANGYLRFANPGATTDGNAFGISLPVVAADLSAELPDQFYFHAGARAFDLPAGGAYAAVGLIRGGDAGAPDVGFDRMSLFATAGAAFWNNTTPFTWDGGTGDGFSWFAEYEAATSEDTNFVS